MNEKLRKSVDELFENAPKTHRATELKEELLSNLMDKYNDLVSSDKSEEEAFKTVMSGIGDVDELIKGLKEQDIFNDGEIQKRREKSTLILSVSVGLYIMSVVVLILLNEVFKANDALGVCVMLSMVAIATGLLIYNAASRPKYLRADDTIVEEFKEWKSASSKEREVIKSAKSILWLIIIAIYFIISFNFGIWSFSWVIFIIGVALERILTLSFELRK